VALADVPAAFVNGLLDTEDKRFYSHAGIDFISLINDTLELVLDREIGTGASTITMQLARNVSFSLERTFIRKFKEMLLALKIEQELTKDEILELYINLVHYGKRAYGAQAAALTYYGKPLDELNLPQLAMLAGIPQAPSAGNPVNGPARALRRRNVVLSRMLAQDSIDQAQFDAAIAEPITARVHARELALPAPFPAEWVRQLLLPRLPDLYTRGYQVMTTINGDMQRAATQALRAGLQTYDRRHGYRGPELRLGVPRFERSTAGADSGDNTDAANAESAALRDFYLTALADTRLRGSLPTAVVTSIGEEDFTALLADGTEITSPWEHGTWAREFYTEDTRGAVPRVPSDVLERGDVIRLRPVADGTWGLSQVPAIQGAVVALDPTTGAVRALEGGFDFAMNQYNHALQAARQPGSGFKPFVYSAALNQGLTPATLFMDAPLVFEDTLLEQQYRPSNDNNRFNGPTLLREAL
jgi:penicillin-binding protein 1A